MVGGEGEHAPRHVVERRARALAVDDVHPVPRRPRHRGEHERPDAGDVHLALTHTVHPPVPADVRRLDEDDALRAHAASPV